MVFPFALAVGVAMALGIVGAPFLWCVATGAACAALQMRKPRAAGPGNGSVVAALATYAGLLILMSLVSGAGYLLGRLFGWARLDV